MMDIGSFEGMPMGKLLLLFFIAIGCSSLQPLLSKQWKNLIDENRTVQHILGLMIIIALLTVISDGTMGNLEIITYSVAAYVWFLFFTKLDIHWTITILVLLMIMLMYENTLKMKIRVLSTDDAITDEQYNEIVKTDTVNRIYMIIGLFVLTIAGVFLYSNKKEIQYGGGYNTWKFLLG